MIQDVRLSFARGRSRRGVTLIELLVVITVLAVLLAVVIPAVQHARESSRATQCRNNLRQLGVAIAGYESTKRHFPAARYRWFSWQVQVLPWLGQQQLYDEIDIQTWPLLNNDVVKSNWVASRSLAVLQCPSGRGITTAATNYLGNTGTGRLDTPGAPYSVVRFENGFFAGLESNGFSPPMVADELSNRYLTVQDFLDGLSNTVAASESVTVARPPSLHAQVQPGLVFRLQGRFPPSRMEYVAAVNDCLVVSGHTRICPNLIGRPWSKGETGATLYHHILSPNSPSCHLAGPTGSYSNEPLVVTASSHHRGGVNILSGDGSVRFVSEDIDLSVWRAVGTRSQREIVEF